MESSEAGLKRKVLAMLRREFPYIWFYKASDRWISGIPDLILCDRGRFVGIELKVGRNAPTRIQSHTLRKITEAGGRTAVCRSVQEVRTFLNPEGGDFNDTDRR